MLAAFGRLNLLWRILSLLGGIGAAGGLLWGAYAAVRHQGYVDGEAEATARCEAEKARQREANRNAIDAGNRHIIRLADELSTSNQEMDDAVASALAAAAADPTGDRECLPLGSVRRVAPIR